MNNPPKNGRPWLKSYPPGYSWEQNFEINPLYDCLDRSVRDFPERPYIHFMGRTFSYGEIGALADRAARGFQDLGVVKGMRVGLFLPNCPQYIICYFGILKAGGTVVNFSPLYSERELEHQAGDSGVELMVTLNLTLFLPKMDHLLKRTGLKKIIVCQLPDVLPFPKNALFPLLRRKVIAATPKDGRHVTFSGLISNRGDYTPVVIDPERDPALLQYTGGTTGVPKGAILTHASLYINLQQLLVYDRERLAGEHCILAALPFFHVYALSLIVNGATFMGWSMAVMPKFELEEALRLIGKYRVSIFAGVPTMYQAILNSPKLHSVNLSSLKSLLSGGAPISAEVKKAFEARAGVRIREGYGLTESSSLIASNPVSPAHTGSVGLPVPMTDVFIVNPDNPDEEMPNGEKGEIAVRGPQMMKGYWNKPEETARSMRGDLFLTGDIGYLNEDGYLYLVDRCKDMILVGGFNVYPRIVEEALYEHPAVKEVTVIGVPDEYLGETPKAFIVLNPDAKPSPKAADLIAFLRDRLGKHELPGAIEFRAELPKTPVGKLSKKELVAEEKAKYQERQAATL